MLTPHPEPSQWSYLIAAWDPLFSIQFTDGIIYKTPEGCDVDGEIFTF